MRNNDHSFNFGFGAILPSLDAGDNTLETKPRVTHDTKVSGRNKTIDTGYTTYCFLSIDCLFVENWSSNMAS